MLHNKIIKFLSFIIILNLTIIYQETAGASDFHVKKGGIKNSGESLSWSLAECYGDISSAISAASSSDRILLEKETHTITTVQGPQTLTAALLNRDEDNDYSSCIINLDSGVSLRTDSMVADTLIKGVTIQNVPSGSPQPALRFFNDRGVENTIIISGCRFTNNRGGTGTGGAIRSSNNDISFFKIYNSVFDNNLALNSGGAIYINEDDPVNLYITGCIFSNNVTENYEGGAISFSGLSAREFYMENCRFYDNTCGSMNKITAYGGALHIGDYVYCEINGCLFENNIAGNSGGAIATRSETIDSARGNLIISKSYFISNKAYRHAGALFNFDYDIFIDDSEFNGNESGYHGTSSAIAGGTIFNKRNQPFGSNISFTLTNSVIANSYMDYSVGTNSGDGSVLITGLNPVNKVLGTIEDCSFESNFAMQGAGFYCGRYAEATVNRCKFTNNIAYDNAGATYKGGGPSDCEGETATYMFCSFINNSSGYESDGITPSTGYGNGGAIMTRLYPKIELINCSFLENKSRSKGDSIFIYPGISGIFDNNAKRNSLINCVFYGENGSDVQIRSVDSVLGPAFNEIVNCTYQNGEFDGNFTENYGAIYIDQNPFISLTDTHIEMTSPCRDSGTDLYYLVSVMDLDGNIVTDIDGNAIGEMPIGSYSYVDTSVVTGDNSAGEESGSSGGSGGGCFIATAAYGSYHHPHVKILRKFRDRILNKNYFGKKIIQFYYKYSPSIACFINRDNRLQIIVKLALLPVILLCWIVLLGNTWFMAFIITFIISVATGILLTCRKKSVLD